MWFIDWGFADAYPPRLETATLARGGDAEFTDGFLDALRMFKKKRWH